MLAVAAHVLRDCCPSSKYFVGVTGLTWEPIALGTLLAADSGLQVLVTALP